MQRRKQMPGRDTETEAFSVPVPGKVGDDALARARALAPVLAAAAPRIEAERQLPGDVVAALHQARMFRLMLPKALGGDELDLATFAEVMEEIAAADASTAWCLGQAGGCAMSAASLVPEVAEHVFGPANAVLAWGAGPAGTAKPHDRGWLIAGQWTFASGCRNATWMGAHCKVIEPDGSPRRHPDGRVLELTALLPREQVRFDDVWHVVGLRGTGSDSYAVQGAVVSDELMIDRDLGAPVHQPGALFRLTGTQAYPAGFGGVMLGIARGMLAELRALAMVKTPRGASSSLRESPVFQTELARLTARWRAARAYHLATYRDLWAEVEQTGMPTLERRMAARLAATHTINEGLAVAVDCHRHAGQSAIFENAPFERRLRDALTAAQQVQGRTSHYTTVGSYLLGHDESQAMFV